MQPDDLIHLATGIVCTIGGWVLKIIWEGMKDMQKEIHSIKDSYVRRDDFKESIGEIKEMLTKIFDKLDTKVDK
jgi:predicted RNA-binding protein with EMAP domain